MKHIYMKRLTIIICLVLLGLFSINQSIAQCSITVSPTSQTVCAGTPVTLTAVFNTATTRTYNIPVSQLVNQGSFCDGVGTNRYNGCVSGNSGFTWTDVGSGTVTNVNIRFYVGIECSVGAHTTTLNGQAGSSFTTSINSCFCVNQTGGGELFTLNYANPSNYSVGGTNTFLANAVNCFGFIAHPAISNFYAVVTVTYTAGGTGSISWSPGGATTNSITVSPSSTTTYTATGTTTGGCSASASSTITVTPLNTIAAGSNRTTCINSAITNITMATTGATGATFSGLPAGVTGSWSGNVATISGTPTVSGTFNYTVTTTGGCPSTTATGTITVTPLNTISTAPNRTVCINSAMTGINLSTTRATGATFSGLPAGVTGSWSGNVVTISGTPTASGTFNYTVTTTGGCTPATTGGTITVTPLNTIAAGSNQTVCINSAITNITLATTGATGATFAGLPAGVTGSWSGNVATISGTPTVSGTFNYTVTTTGGCPPATATGTITITPLNTIAAGASRTVCINSAITNITMATTGATGATFAGLPAGVTGSWSGNLATISGTPTVSGTFNYTVTTIGGCNQVTATGTITVTPLNTIAAGSNQTVCINSAITNITMATTGATGATFAGLPAGVTGSWSGNVATISGTPTASGTFNYTVTTIGGCNQAIATGTITVTPLNTIAAGLNQTVCINSAITNITIATTGATGATFAGLPAGVTGSWSANVATISGTPTASGTFNYTVSTTGGCAPATTTGIITVNSLPTISISGNTTACSSVSLTASGAATYVWTGGDTPNSATNTFTNSGTYTVTGTTAANCVNTNSATVAILNQVTGSVGFTNATCTQNGSITVSNVQIPVSANGVFYSSTFTGIPAGSVISGSTVISGNECILTPALGSQTGYLAFNALASNPLGFYTTFDYRCADGSGADGTSFNYGALANLSSAYEAGTSVGLAIRFIEFAGSRIEVVYNGTVINSTPFALVNTSYRTVNVSVTASGQVSVSVAGTTVISNAQLPAAYLTDNKSSWQYFFAARCGGLSNKHSIKNLTIGGQQVEYSINNSTWQVSPTFSVPAGNYSVYVRVNENGTTCTGALVGTANVTKPNGPVVSISGSTTNCAVVSLTASGASTYSWSGGSSVNTAANTFSTSGTFTVIGTDASGCTSSVSTTVTVTPLNTITAGSNQTVCINSAITNITMATTGATGATFTGLPAGVTGSWSGNVATISGTPTASGTFNYTVTTTGGCPPATATGTITVYALPNASITAGGPTTFCAGGSVVLTASAGTSFLWSTGATTSSINVTTSGSYTVTVTNASGCTATSAASTVTVNPLTVNAPGSWTATGSMGSVREWNTSTVLQNGKVLVTGGYYFGSSARETCELYDPATGTWTPTGSMSVGRAEHTATLLNNGKVLVTTGFNDKAGYITTSELYDPSTGTWTLTGDMLYPTFRNTATLLPNGKVLVTGGYGPTLVKTETQIFDPSTNSWSAGPNMNFPRNHHTATLLPNGLVLIAGGANAYGSNYNSAELYNPATNTWTMTGSMSVVGRTFFTANLLNNGKVLVAGGSGNAITELYDPSTGTWSTTGSLAGNRFLHKSVLLPNGNVIVSGGNATGNTMSEQYDPATGLWTASGNNLQQRNNFSAVLLNNGKAMVVGGYLKATSELYDATVSISGANILCAGTTSQLTSNVSGGVWSSSNTGVATINASGLVSAVAAGTTTITYTITNGFGCQVPFTFGITVNALPTPTITAGGPTTFCAGGSVVLTASAGTSYLWSNGATTQSITVNTTGSFTVQVSNASGCFATSAASIVTVNALPTPTITAGGPTTFCAGGSVTLTASAGSSYAWSNGATTQSINVTTSGSNTVTVTNASGCTATSSATIVTVNPLPTPTITAGSATTFCAGGSVTLTASAGSSYLWSNGETTQSIVVTSAGSYTVQVTSAAGCFATSTATTVTVNPLPETTITASGSTTICQGSSVTLNGPSAATGGNAMTFGGRYIHVPNSSSISIGSGTTYTIESWIKVSDATNNTIVDKGDYNFLFQTHPNGNQGLGLYNRSFGWIYSSGVVPVNQWLHVAVTYNNRTVKFYQNGVLQGTYTASANSTGDTGPMNIGRQSPYTCACNIFDGSMDELRLWNVARTQADIQASMNANIPSSSTGLVAYYKFDEGSGSTITDATANVNNGSMVGAPIWLVPSTSPLGSSATPLSYVWSPGAATTPSIVASASGNYSVTVTNTTTGCSATSTPTTVTVNPLPTITCTANITVPATSGLCGANVTYNPATATGTPAPTITYSQASGSFFPVGTTTVTATATNSCGTVSCNFTVTVTDIQAPVITCPSNISVYAVSASGAVVNYTVPVGTDNCSGVTTTRIAGLASGTTFPIGVTTVTYKVTDASGNTAQCSFTVTVAGLAPVIVCPSNITVNNDAGQCGANVSFAATETIGIPASVITYSHAPGSFFPVGTTTVTATATNAVGAVSCSFTVTVIDNTPPTIICAQDVTINNVPGQCYGTVVLNSPTVVDNCVGSLGNGLAFDGSNDYVNCGTAASITNLGPGGVTMEAWVNPTRISGVNSMIRKTGDYDLIIINGKLYAEVWHLGNTSGSFKNAMGTTNIPLNAWTHVAAVWNGSTFKLFVNGILDPASVSTSNALVSEELRLGNSRNYNQPYAGALDEVRIWNLARTDAQILANINNELNAQTGLVAAYHFNQGVAGASNPTVTTLADASGNANTGALNSFTLNGTTSNWVAGRVTGSSTSITNNAPANFPIGNTTVTWTATDAAGNVSTCSQTVTVVDNQAPVITCPANQSVFATSAAGAVVTYTAPVGTDNCSGSTTTLITGLASGSIFPIGTTTVAYRVTDAAGLTADCSFTVTVSGLAPVITCPANITLNSAAGLCGNTATYAATETVGIPASTITYSIPSGSFFPVGTTTVTATATNAVGSSSCSFNVIVVDNENPVITVPLNVVHTADPGLCSFSFASVNSEPQALSAPDYTYGIADPVLLGMATATDNCGSVTVSGVRSDAAALDAPYPVGVTTIIWTATDSHGNSASGTQTVTISDNERPTITAPAAISVNNDAGNCSAVVAIGSPVTGDNCAVASVTNDHASSTYPVGTTIVTWTVTDIHGNSSSATQTIIVTDNERPTITAPAAISVNNDAGVCAATIAIGSPVTGDNCSVATVTNDHPSTTFPVGTTNVTWTVTDIHGLQASTVQIVTVTDAQAPTVITQNITVNLDANGAVSITPSQINNGSFDNCAIATYSLDKTSFSCSNVGANTVILTVTDVNGNVSTLPATVTVVDNIAPTVITQNITVNLDANGAVSITPSQINNGSFDNCAIATITLDKTSFNCANVGVNTVILTVTDVNGNVSSSPATVSVVDNIAPTVITQNITVNLDANGAVSITPSQINNGSFDNCSIATITLDKTSFNCANVGANTVILTVTDVNGNVSSSPATVSVVDNIVPTVITQNITVNLDANGTVSITPSQINNGSFDNCSIATITLDKTSFNCSNVGANTVILTVTDVNGNVSSSPATVSVVDNIAPTVITQNITVNLDANGAVSITPSQINNGSFDNCSIATITLNKTSFNCANVGANTVILTVTDVNGNVSTSPATVTVVDNIAPTVITQNITVNLDANGAVSITPSQINNGSFDNCSIATITLNKTSFNCANVGANTVILTVTDVNGNVSTLPATVTVVDNIAPTVITQNITVNLDANGAVSFTPSQINNGSFDNCAIATISLDKTSFNCANVGSNTVILTVTDVNGNVSTQTAVVTVVDNIAPTVITQNITVNLDANGAVSITPSQINNGSFDNCAIATYSLDKTSFNCSNVGANTVILTVTDVNGNVSTLPATVTVVDNIAPTVITQNITVNLDANGTVSITPSQINNGSFDNCSIATITLDKTSFNCANVGANTVILTVTDVNGNVSTSPATVTVVDNIAPTVITQNITMNLGANGAVSITPSQINNGSFDNCAIATITLDKTSFNCSNVGGNTVVLTVTDVNGNVSTLPATVTVVDNIAPTVITQNITVNLDASGAISITPSQINNGSFDNCSIATIILDKTSFNCSNVGANTVILTVTDVNGNVTTQTAVVTVVDNIAPTVITQNITVNLDANGAVSITPSQINNGSFDNCSIATITLDKTSFNCSNVGANTVILTVTDVNGNISTSPATVTVVDNIAPTVITQNITVNLDANGAVSITPSQINNGSFDNCSIATYSLDKTSFNCSNLGANTVILTVTDVNGNVSTQTAVVTVVDNIAPTVITQNITVNLDANGAVSITPSQINNGSFDNCSIATITLDKTSFNCSNVGANTVILTVTDVNGNVSTLPATVTVVDNIAPTVITQNITVNLDANGAVSITPLQINNGSFDNCSIATYSLDKTSFNCSNVGANTVILTVTDVNGNVSTSPATVTVVDNIAPTVITQNITVNLDANGAVSITPSQINNGSFDNCSIATITLDKTSFNCANVGANTVILTVTDVNGNVSSSPATVSVVDNIVPTVITQNITVNLDANGTVSITPSQINNGSFDNCSIATITLDKTSFNCSNVGANTVILTVTDVNGNVSSSPATVSVVDNIAPTVITQNITVNLDANGAVSITPSQINNGSFDNCSIATITLNKTSFNCANVGANTVILTVTDVNGNVSTSPATVTVVDNIAPTVITQNITVNLDANGAVSITPSQINNGSFDNCSIATITLNKTSFNCANVGANTVILTVTDVNGNVSTLPATVTVVDNIAPIVTQPTAQTFCANANGSNVYTIPVASATDNCTIATITYSVTGATTRTGTGYNASGAFAIGTSNITWTITDVNGNITQRSTTVVINPLPVATYVSSNADAFCNGVTLTGSSSINAATYSWSNTNAAASFSNSSLLNLGLSNADGNYYLYVKATATGCVSATSAVYNYQKQTLSSSYTILAYKEVELGKYNKVVTGSVGVMTSKGEAEFKSYTSVNGVGAFVKAPRIDKDGSGILIPNQIIGIATVTLPAMQLNTSSTNNLPSFTASVNNATLSGNYKNLTIKKGISVTLTNNTFGSIRLEEGASVRFTNSILNIESLTADKGARNNDYSYVRFAPNTSVRVSSKVSFGSQVLVNPEANKVTFYMGDNRKDEEKFTVKGGDTRVIANVFMPDGKLRVTATDSDDDDRGNCDHRAHDYRSCRHRGHEHNDCDHRGHQASSCNDDVYMTGLFIAEEVESKGNTVIWNSFNCSAPAPVQPIVNKTGTTQTVTEEKTEVKASTEEELKVTVMPNPSTTYFTLKLESKYETPVNLRVMDGSGRVVDAKSKIGSNSTFQIGHNYSSGTYYAELIQGTKRKVVQLIKARG